MRRFVDGKRILPGFELGIAFTTVPRLDENRVRLCAGGRGKRAGRPSKFSRFSYELEARGVEPLSSSLSTQTSTCLSDDKF